MVEKIIELSVKNKFIILFFVALLSLGSFWAIKNTSLDALPDLSPPQVILQIKWQGQSPQTIEEQISYPLITNLMSLQNISTIRAMSGFEDGLVYIIFKDGTDLYDARTRVLEKLSQLNSTFPSSSTVELGVDATGVGWAYQYALKSDTKSLDELRSLQDYYYRFALLGVDGVSEIAPIGGFVKNYEVTINQDKLRQHNLTINDIKNIIQVSNDDKGGRLILENGFEQIVTAKGYLKDKADIENLTITVNNAIPLKIKDIADVNIVPASRRGMADLDGQGEVVGGIVVVRFGEDPYSVIQKVKEKFKTLQVDGVEVVEVYDRTSLIDKAIKTLSDTLIKESLFVMLIVAIFLSHFRSALIVVIVLPITVVVTFLMMKFFGIGSNILSLGGIAIAIGAMIDASIVMIENAHKHIHKHIKEFGEISNAKRVEIIVQASKQVGRPIFFAMILVVVSFLPIFALDGQEGKLFHPLAFTKTFAMIGGAILAITLVPVLMLFLLKGEIQDENKSIVNRFFQFIYSPILKLSLKFRYVVLGVFVISLAFAYPIYNKLKWEFMPMMNEQTFMYMPVTPYGIGIDMAQELTQKTNEIIASFPEVKSVFGKAGKASSATDPAPLSMIETIIEFKPQVEWREGMTYKELLFQMDQALQVEGLINSWTYPIRGRIDMLLSGIRTPLGIKLYGNDRDLLEKYASEIEGTLREYNGTLSISSDKANSGYYLNIEIDSEKLARYGITKDDIFSTISYGVGGNQISTMIQGLERYPISLRYDITQRDDINKLGNLLIKTKYGYQPLSSFATLKYEEGASVIKSEKGMNVSFIYITPKEGFSAKLYKEDASKLLKEVKLPAGFYYEFAGESEYIDSAMKKLVFIFPITLMIIFILIYFALKNFTYSVIIFTTLPFALLGGLIYIDLLYFNLSIAVIVGFLALLGIAAETSIVMMIYLDDAIKEMKEKVSNMTKSDIFSAVYAGAVLRLRPKLMTMFSTIGGLLPIMFIDGVGSEVMQRIAAPMIGGMVSSAILTLLIIPAIFFIVYERRTNV